MRRWYSTVCESVLCEKESRLIQNTTQKARAYDHASLKNFYIVKFYFFFQQILHKVIFVLLKFHYNEVASW